MPDAHLSSSSSSSTHPFLSTSPRELSAGGAFNRSTNDNNVKKINKRETLSVIRSSPRSQPFDVVTFSDGPQHHCLHNGLV